MTMYRGRVIDPLALWGEFIDLPNNLSEPLPTYLPKVRCPNPAHDTTKHHFQVNTKKPLVHCFADCGISGSWENAIKLITGCSDDEARRTILRHSRAALKGEATAYGGLGTRKSVTHEDETAKDQRALDGGAFHWMPKEARAYLDKRGIDGNSKGKWKLGWDEDAERVVIPAYDHRGTFRFLIRQRIDGFQRGKYLYTKGSVKTNILFGACYFDQEQLRSTGRIVLCEGPLDAIRLQQLGVRTAASILGTGISTAQVRLIDKLGPERVYLFFDKDEAGWHNIQAAKERIKKVPLYVCRYPKGKGDPAEMTREEVERSLERALTIHEFYRKAQDAIRTDKRQKEATYGSKAHS